MLCHLLRHCGIAYGDPSEAILMARAQPDGHDRSVTLASEITLKLSALYIVSSALAQRGAQAQEIHDAQWQTIAQRTHEAKSVLDQLLDRPETQAIALLRQMIKMCQDLVDRHAAHQDIPFTVWREVDRLGREVYECVNAFFDRQQ